MKSTLLYLALAFAFLALLSPVSGTSQVEPAAPTKVIKFAVNEDYDKNQDLAEVAKDFQLMRELEIDEMRVSFGWDDYEPQNDKFDFVWLHKFADLAAQYGIKLRPYLCYAPAWAGNGHWNSPPRKYSDWYNFCYTMAREMKRHPNILSWEIWNEEDASRPSNPAGGQGPTPGAPDHPPAAQGAVPAGPDNASAGQSAAAPAGQAGTSPAPSTTYSGWWGGTTDDYLKLLRTGSVAIQAADPGKQILLGGMASRYTRWMKAITDVGYGRYYDVTPIHCYRETWGGRRAGRGLEDLLSGESGAEFFRYNELGGGQPIWVNEIGYSTMERSEEQQANYLARAVGFLLSFPKISYISWYEIKDMDPAKQAIGDAHNFHLGITTFPERRKKLAFYTLDMLSDLLDGRSVTPAAEEVTVTPTAGTPGRPYKWLFKLADGAQVLFVYDTQADCTVNVTLATPGKTAYKYELDNSSAVYPQFANNTISDLHLTAGRVAVFKIVP